MYFENDNDLDSHIEKIVSYLELEDEEQKGFQQEAIALPGMFMMTFLNYNI